MPFSSYDPNFEVGKMNPHNKITKTPTDAGTAAEGARKNPLQWSHSSSSYERSDESNVAFEAPVTGAERSSGSWVELRQLDRAQTAGSIGMRREIEAEKREEKLQNDLHAYIFTNAILVGALVRATERNSVFKPIRGQRGEAIETENLQKQLQMYMNAINAILVGASVIASVTFSGFLQPPHNPKFILHFCIYSSLSFYSAVATVIIGAGATLPSWKSDNDPKEEVEKAQRWVRVTSVLFAFSITCVLGAIPQPNYGDPPKLTRNRELTVVRNIGLFLCAAAMTAYVLRLCVLVLLGLASTTERTEGKSTAEKWLSRHKKASQAVVCALIYSIFLAVLFYLPFYASFEDEWKAPLAAGPQHG